MTSKRQIEANRENARRSTGPKSNEGKKAVRYNALQHGLLSRDVVLPDEDEDAFEDLRNAVLAYLAPLGPVEEFLANRAVNSIWRLYRLERVEVALFHWRGYALKANSLQAKVSSFEKHETIYKDTQTNQILAEFAAQTGSEIVTTITDEAAHAKATTELNQARFERSRDETLLGRSFNEDANDADAFGKLSRYETSLERSLLRNLDALHRLQRDRQAAPVMDIEEAV
jgi:hypothetical protein|tara:strand:+ start:502 stop:1185 length:684 start_codon:yes stop_codon:yes gene_type:complete